MRSVFCIENAALRKFCEIMGENGRNFVKILPKTIGIL